jgi:hypothetical protein
VTCDLKYGVSAASLGFTHRRSLLHDVAALPPQMEWEQARFPCALMHRTIGMTPPPHQILETIGDFCSDLCVFVGKRARATPSATTTTSSSSSGVERACNDIEVRLGLCVTCIDCGVHANLDVVSRDLDFLSSSWRRLLQLPSAVVAVSSPVVNVMLNADSLVALPLLLLLQAKRSTPQLITLNPLRYPSTPIPCPITVLTLACRISATSTAVSRRMPSSTKAVRSA